MLRAATLTRTYPMEPPHTAMRGIDWKTDPDWLADECEESARLWAHEIDTRQRAATELRRLHAQAAQDEALLRQALEVLGRAHQTAMEQTLFAGIAQDLDFVVAALRERLGVKA